MLIRFNKEVTKNTKLILDTHLVQKLEQQVCSRNCVFVANSCQFVQWKGGSQFLP